MEMKGNTLYVVATPIGNLGDLSPRAAEVLCGVDFVAAEDTRVTVKLLNHIGAKKPLVSCYSQNELNRSDEIISRILAGESCALCSDAGTPAISDPGEKLVSCALDAGVSVCPISGPSALVTALSVCGLPVGRFAFEGFIPVSKKNRHERLSEIKDEKRALVFYEAPHKLKNTLRDLLATFGDRPVTVARELTKLHEEITRSTLKEVNDYYSVNEPRGEFVLVLAPPERVDEQALDSDAALRLARQYVSEGLTLSKACSKAAQQTKMSKSELYRLALDGDER